MALRDDWEATFLSEDLQGAAFICPHCEKAATFSVAERYRVPTLSNNKYRTLAILKCGYIPCSRYVDVETTKVPSAAGQYQTDEVNVYPSRAIHAAHSAIPPAIAEDWVEAPKAFAVSALKASAVMCRRVLYGVLLDKKCKEHPMRDGLKQLAEQERLPRVVEQWLNEIKDDGHDAAHPHRALQVPAENISEVLEYTKELLRFIYIEPHELQARLSRKVAPTGTAP